MRDYFFSAVVLLLFPAMCQASSDYNWSCNLYCYHNGQCRHGKGEFGSYQSVHNLEPDENPWEAETHVSGMYCQCPVGYTGVQCEISLIMCDIGGAHDNHTCFNGSECRKGKDGYGTPYYHCACDSETTVMEFDYVKKYCDHIGTVFCGQRNGDDVASSMFCNNGGRCRAHNHAELKEHPGCDCLKGWEGHHCEIPAVGSWSYENLVNQATDPGNIFAFCFLAIVVICGGLTVMMWKDKKKRKKERRQREEEDRYGSGFFPKEMARPSFSDEQSARTSMSSSNRPREII